VVKVLELLALCYHKTANVLQCSLYFSFALKAVSSIHQKAKNKLEDFFIFKP
tara:strand:- start:265 stop:420 length:156 start_codon:yes stop_codon:yes gene_type:complete